MTATTTAALAIRFADLDLACWCDAAAQEAQRGLQHPGLTADSRDYLKARLARLQAVAGSLRDRHGQGMRVPSTQLERDA